MSVPVRGSLAVAFRRFLRSEDGNLTVMGLFLFLMMAMMCGIAVDAARLQALTVQMQNAADSAAHAALITRRTASASVATDRAVAVAQSHMPPSRYGTVLAPADVEFGRWNASTRAFTADPSGTNTVRVTIRQTKASGNAFYTSLLHLVGVKEWNATRSAVYGNLISACQRQSIISQGAMRFSSNNQFYAPVCLHSNTSFQLDTGNTFETGVSVSVPSSSSVITPNSNSNPGFNASLSYRTMDVAGLIRPIPDIINGLTTPGSTYIPSYITNHTALSITTISSDQYEIKPGQLTSGRIYRATCNSNGTTNPQTVVVKPLAILSRVVLVTNCRVRLENGVRLEDVVIATSRISPDSINGGSDVVVGKNDNCASGGGAQLVTRGGIYFGSAIHIHGSQLLATQDIHINANAAGTQGFSIVAGGQFTNTSEGRWRTCAEASVENTYQARNIAALVQ